MNKDEFEKLSLEEKAYFIWHNGHHLETIHYACYLVNIYHLNKFLNYQFAEVFYNPDHERIDKISLVDKIDLNKFLTEIDITDLNLPRQQSK